jgi:hypothetical protein
MRIDSGGNVLVGKTTIAGAFNTVGSEIRASGLVQSTVDGSKCIDLNRLSSDGDILGFSKAGTSVGSIGVDGGDNLYITGQTGNTGGIYMNDAAVSPAYQGSERDNYYNLGKAPARWKDLYLSGGVYLGGTGSANKLDDYEEGTWSPNFAAAGGGSLTTTSNSAYYTKVGNLVTAWFDQLAWSSHNLTGTYLNITGLPFPLAGSRSVASPGVSSSNSFNSLDRLMVQGDSGASTLWMISMATTNNNYAHMAAASVAATGTWYGMTITYRTA